MLLGVENLVFNSLFFEEMAEDFRTLDTDGTNEYRLPLFIALLYFESNSFEFLLFGTVDKICLVDAGNGAIGRDDYYIEAGYR